MKLIEKILQFEDGTETVESFNEIFSTCPIFGFNSSEIVTIGLPCSPETCRELTVLGQTFRHNFVKDNSEVNVEVLDD